MPGALKEPAGKRGEQRSPATLFTGGSARVSLRSPRRRMNIVGCPILVVSRHHTHMPTRTQRRRGIRWGAWLLSPFVLLFLGLLPIITDEWTPFRTLLLLAVETGGILFLVMLWSDSTLGLWASRGLGAIIFLLCLGYFVDEWFVSDRPFQLVERRSDTTPRNALIALIVFGLPCLWHAVRPRRSAAPGEVSDQETHNVGG